MDARTLLGLTAIGLGLCAAPPAAAQPDGAPRVLVVTDRTDPQHVDVQLLRATELYLRDLRHEIVAVAALPADAAEARTLATARDARLVVWWTVAPSRPQLDVTVRIVDRDDAAGELISFRVAGAANAGLFRLIALKLRGELATLLRGPGAEPPPPAPPPPEAPVAAAQVVVPRPARPHRVTLEAAAVGALPTDLSTGLFFVGLSARARLTDRWALGIAGAYEVPSSVSVSTGAGQTTGGRVAAAVRARLAGRPAGRGFGLFAELQVGIAVLHTSAHLDTDPTSQSATRVLPVLTLQALGAYRAHDRFAILFGPTVDFFPIHQSFLVHGVAVRDTGWVLPGLQLALQVSL